MQNLNEFIENYIRVNFPDFNDNTSVPYTEISNAIRAGFNFAKNQNKAIIVSEEEMLSRICNINRNNKINIDAVELLKSEESSFGKTMDASFLINDLNHLIKPDLIQIPKIKIEKIEEKGVRGVSNNRKSKIRKKAKNGKKKK